MIQSIYSFWSLLISRLAVAKLTGSMGAEQVLGN